MMAGIPEDILDSEVTLSMKTDVRIVEQKDRKTQSLMKPPDQPWSAISGIIWTKK